MIVSSFTPRDEQIEVLLYFIAMSEGRAKEGAIKKKGAYTGIKSCCLKTNLIFAIEPTVSAVWYQVFLLLPETCNLALVNLF